MNPYLPEASFPVTVWDGTSYNKINVHDCTDPGYRDHNRISSEVIAVQDFLTTPFSFVDFQIDAEAPPHNEGRVFYDSEEKTFAIYNNESDVTLQLGQEIYIRATNKTGVLVDNGKLCYISGAQGNRPTIELARADSPNTSKVLGITTHDIDDNATGFLTVLGLVRGLNTNAFTEGDSLYLSDTVAGEFTNIMPSAPSFPLQIGIVVRKNIEEGAILASLGPTDVVGPMVIQALTINTTFDVSGITTLSDDLLFTESGSGLTFGEIFVDGNENTTTLNSSGYVQVIDFDSNGVSNNTTPGNADDHILIIQAGIYLVNISMILQNDAGIVHDIDVKLFKNNGATVFDNIHASKTLLTGSDIENIFLSGMITVATNDTLELWAITSRASDSDVTFKDITFSILQIGGV